MKIDYELAEKIGATHYFEMRDGDGYTLIDSSTINTHSNGMFSVGKFACVDKHGSVVEIMATSFGLDFLLSKVKPIPPKPPVRVEYEQVDSVKPGDRLFWLDDGQYNPCLVIGWHPEQPVIAIEHDESIGCVMMSSLYRSIEKPVDWRDEVVNYVESTNTDSGYFNVGYFNVGYECEEKFLTSDEFLEMCLIALKAAGKI